MYWEILISVFVGYLLGSIPFALVIGKLFFKIDIRNFGSKNLGGGNAGRVLGKRAGLSVMTLDILKVTLAVFIASNFPHGDNMMMIAGLAAAIGHCFPIFARFKGGKAVATMYGFLFGMMVVGSYSPWIFFLPLIVFLIILYWFKIIALASICSAAAATIYTGITIDSWLLLAVLFIFDVLIVWRHRANLARMRKGEENKISWM